MTPRDRLQRLLIEHRTAHDPASSEREILAMFEDLEAARPPRFGRIGFFVDGLDLRLRGPVPSRVADAAEFGACFASRSSLFAWLDKEWPGWEMYEEKIASRTAHTKEQA